MPLRPLRRPQTPSPPFSSIASVFQSPPDAALLSPIFLPGSDHEIEHRSFHTLLPLVSQLVQLYKQHPEIQSFPDFRIACAVCPRIVQFRGWQPLLIHAGKFWKSFPLQHQGYHRALEEAFKVEKFNPLPADPVAWPPVLLVENAGLKFDGSLRRWKGLQGLEVPENLKDMEIEEILAVYRKRNGHGRDVIVFPAAEVGLVDAKKLSEVLEKSPESDDWVKLRVEKPSTCPQKTCDNAHLRGYGDTCDNADLRGCKNTSEKSNAQDGPDDGIEYREDETSTSDSCHDYDKHLPLGTWATLKEIRESGQVDSVMRKWARSFAGGKDYCAFAYKWPFQKSRKLREMDIKFQKDLQRYTEVGAAGNEKLRAQLDEIEKQLRKERLLWLKEVTEIREQFEGLEKDIKKEEAQKALDKHIWEMRIEREIAKEMEELEERMQRKCQLQLGRSEFKKRQKNMRNAEKKRDALLKTWRCEQSAFRKQAEMAKEERHCIGRSIENEEMLEALSRALGRCGCIHADDAGFCGVYSSTGCADTVQDHGHTTARGVQTDLSM